MPVFNSVDRVITVAMRGVGLLQKGEVPDAQDYLDYTPRLIDLVKLYQTQGLKLWLNNLTIVPLVAGTATYSLGPAGTILTTKPMRVLEGYYVDAIGASRELSPLAIVDYNRLGNPTQQGSIVTYLVKKSLTDVLVTFWSVPDAAAALGVVKLLVQTAYANYVNETSILNFPEEWYIALCWGLAAEIGVGQPKAVVDEAIRKADKYRAMLEDWDVEDVSVTFQPAALMAPAGRFG